MERFADIQLLRYELKDFETLTLQQKMLIYCLAEATLWGRDITFDQFGRYNLRIRQLLEKLYGIYGEEEKELATYLKRVWFSNGIYHHYSCQKMLPEMSKEHFMELAKDANICVDDELLEVMFNPTVLPKRVNHADGEDLVVTSACNFYEGVTQQEVSDYYAAKKTSDEDPSWGLNTRLSKVDGKLQEEVCRIGGRYSGYIEKIVYWLREALNYAEDEQQEKVIALLIDYYTTGDLAVFDQYSIEWVKQTMPRIDFINGFIEVYGDPMGLKGSWEGIVHYKDLEATHRTEVLSQNAQWFEDNSPVDARFKKPVVKGVTANVVCAAMLGGDEYPSTAIGINLPNADWIRAKHGSKSITISNLTAAYDKAAKGNGFREEYVAPFLSPEAENMRALIDKYSNLTDDLHTDLHECLGHGSGQLLPGVAADALKSYASTIEEARADLFGLYYMADPKMVELGLLPDNEAFKAQYFTYMMNGLLTQCVRIPLGEDIQEAHMRNRAIIANWTMAQCKDEEIPAVELYKNDGKTYMRINDYQRLRELFGELLAEIQRMKSEGDLEAARQMVEKYGVKLNMELHKEIRQRYERLNIAPYKGFINPIFKKVEDADGNVIDIEVDMEESYVHQMMRYSKDYSLSEQAKPSAHDVARSIRQRFRTRMNGVVSENMRNKGMDYRVNWGISLRHLMEMASEYEKDLHVALELWNDNVRESKIMALLLMPAEEFTTDLAELWIESLLTQEMSEMAAMLLFKDLPYAPELAFRLIAQTNPLHQILGYNILSRLFAADNIPDARGLAELMDQIRLAINEDNLSVRHAAYNCYQKLSMCDKLADSPYWHALCQNIECK